MKFSTVKKALITAFAASANAYDLLKDYSGDLKVGVAANSMKFSNSNYVNAMKAFNMMVAENACKLSGIQQQKGNYNFNDCDAHYNKAKELGMEFRGHTLVWHAHMPQWFEGADANTLKSAIVDHVTKVLKHYEGKIKVWDVVNEAVDDSSNGNGFQLRNSFLRQKVPDFIDLAFKTAREVSPDTKLFYNDYNAEGQYPKSESIYNFVADLKKRNIPIDGVGLQYHVGANSQPAFDKINNLIGRYCKLGLEVHITELDVKLEGNQNGQTQAYSNALKACLANSCCKAFLVWGVGDSDSWLGGNEQALLFNNNYQPKPVYNTLLDILKKEAKPAAKEEPANSAAATTVVADTAAATTAADEKKTETKVNKSTTTKTIPASLLTKTQSKTKTIPESLLTKTQSKTKTIPSATTIPATKTLPTSKFTKTLPDTTKPKTLPNTTKTIPSAPLTNTTPKTESAVANTTRTTKTVPQSILDMIAAKTIPSSLLTKTKTKTIPESLLTKTGTKTIPSTLLTKTTPEASTTEVLTTTQVANEAAKTDATATTTATDAAAATTAIGTTATVTGTDAAEATTKTEAATTDVTTIEPTTGATTKTTKTVPQSILDMIAAKSLGLTKTVTNTVSQTKTVPDTQCTSCAGNQNNLNIINNDNSTTNNNINNFNITNNNNTTNNINNNSTTNNISNNSTTNNITNTNNTSNVNNYYYIVYTTIDDGKAKTTSSIVSIPATDIPTASAGKPAPTVSVPVPEEIPSDAVIATKPVPSSIASKISSKACSKNKTKTNTVSATKSVPLTTTTKAVPEKTIINENDDTKTTTPKTDAPITATRTTKTVPQSILDKISKSCTKSKTNTVSTTKTLPVTTSVTEPAEGPIAEPTTEPVDEPIPEPIVETTTTIGGKITKTKKVTKTTTKTKPAADKCTCEPVTVTVTVTEKCASVETTAADAAVSDEAAKSTAPKTAEEVNPDDEEDNPERNPEAVSSNKCARRFARCGGLNYRGPKCCQSGSRCYYINRWISQCL